MFFPSNKFTFINKFLILLQVYFNEFNINIVAYNVLSMIHSTNQKWYMYRSKIEGERKMKKCRGRYTYWEEERKKGEKREKETLRWKEGNDS